MFTLSSVILASLYSCNILKELWEEAKKMNDKDDSGDFKCKMRGPLGSGKWPR
jgi:hypothetical protein